MKDSDNQALEYVLGTLRMAERESFKTRLEQEPELADTVEFWEGQLLTLHQDTRPLAPADVTWQSIETRLNSRSKTTPTRWERFVANSWQWLASSALTIVLCVSLWFIIPFSSPTAPTDPASYMAVMTDENGAPVLTALAFKGEKSLWLQWADGVVTDASAPLQLQALSRTDATSRTLAVLDDVGQPRLQISKAEWGLIKDAEYLILTQESIGVPGTKVVLAKGLCIQFQPDRES